MIRDERRELLRVLAELSEEVPDVRFGQLIANLSYLGRGLSAESIWDVDDEDHEQQEHGQEERGGHQHGA